MVDKIPMWQEVRDKYQARPGETKDMTHLEYFVLKYAPTMKRQAEEFNEDLLNIIKSIELNKYGRKVKGSTGN